MLSAPPMQRATSSRRPKSPAASRIAQRPRALENPPWDWTSRPQSAAPRPSRRNVSVEEAAIMDGPRASSMMMSRASPSRGRTSHVMATRNVMQRTFAPGGHGDLVTGSSTPYHLPSPLMAPQQQASPPSMGAMERRDVGFQPSHGTPNDTSSAYSVNSASVAGGASYFPPMVLPSPPHASIPQLDIVSRLQDVVVELSQSAVSEKQRLSHMQQRIDAYAALVREQDRMIEELRGMNIKLQKERDALIAFRHQSLNHDFLTASMHDDAAFLDEEERRSAGRYLAQASGASVSYVDPSALLSSMNAEVRQFVRSLIAQLRNEKRRRLEVEEQSSRMIGEQQLTIHRLEDRHRQAPSTLGGPLHASPSAAAPHSGQSAAAGEETSAGDRDVAPSFAGAAPVPRRERGGGMDAVSFAMGIGGTNPNPHRSASGAAHEETALHARSHSSATSTSVNAHPMVGGAAQPAAPYGANGGRGMVVNAGERGAAGPSSRPQIGVGPDRLTEPAREEPPAATSSTPRPGRAHMTQSDDVAHAPTLAAGLSMGLDSVGATYEDATALLAEIRKRHGL